MANTFTLTTDAYGERYMQLYCVQTTNIATNKSTINWTLSSIGGTSNYYTTGPTTVTIAGKQVYYREKVAWDTKVFPAAKGSISGSLVVDHDAYGNKTIAVSMSTSIYTGVVKTYSGNWSLDSIPRNAKITSATNFTDLDNPSISFSNPGNFTMDVWLEPNPVGDHLCVRTNIPNTGSYTWSLTDAEREALRSKCVRNSCTIRLGLYTYINGVQYADYKDMTYTMTENAATKPSVEVEISLNNGNLPSAYDGMYIQGVSKVDVRLSATGKYGAGIGSYYAKIGDKIYYSDSFTSDEIQGVGAVDIIGYAKDSRGFTGEAKKSVNVIEYSKPSVTVIAYRCNSSGEEDREGAYIRVGFTATITSLDGENSATYIIDHGGTPITGTGTSYLSEPIACDVSRVVSVEVKVSDAVSSTTKSAVIPIAFTLMDFYHTGMGVALGKVATRNGFDCAMDAYFGNRPLQEVGSPIADTDAVNLAYLIATYGDIKSDPTYPDCYYRIVDGQKEWLNPPMVSEGEYRTTERWAGKPVYTKIVPFGSLPNATSAYVNWYPNSGNVSQVISAVAVASGGSMLNIVDSANRETIWIITDGDYSAQTASVVLKYTKV